MINNIIIAIAVIGAFVAGSFATISVVSAQSDTIIACVHTGEGKDMRLVDSADNCRKNEIPLEWNVQGPQGPAGADGADGTSLTFYNGSGDIGCFEQDNVGDISSCSASCNTGDVAVGPAWTTDEFGGINVIEIEYDGPKVTYTWELLEPNGVFFPSVKCANTTP